MKEKAETHSLARTHAASSHDVQEILPGWKAALMHPTGRNVLVKAVLTAIPIHHLMVLQCLKWVLKAIDKIRRGFLWKGRRDIRGGGTAWLIGAVFADQSSLVA
jgi:hypothetical protein